MKKSSVSKIRVLTGIGILFAIMSISNSCTKSAAADLYGTGTGTGAKGTTSGPGTNEVWIQNMAFSPATITVAVGTKITWTNKDAMTHTVTSNTSVFDSNDIGTNGTFSFTFSASGTFQYSCKVHPSMTATVIVN